jgi:addiction module HigA family antidote
VTAEPPVIHPGQVLLEEVMRPLGVSRAQLARDIDVPIDRLRAVILGRVGINADLALRLGRHFGTNAELWMKLQSDYDLATARGGSWQQVERRIRVFGTGTAPVAAEPSPKSQAEPPPSPEDVEGAANENLARRVEELAPEANEPASAVRPEGEEASTDPLDASRPNEEEPLELTELIGAGRPEPDGTPKAAAADNPDAASRAISPVP